MSTVISLAARLTITELAVGYMEPTSSVATAYAPSLPESITAPELMLTPSRHEIIREHLYRELSKASYSGELKSAGRTDPVSFSTRAPK
jgi:hypothetical protein